MLRIDIVTLFPRMLDGFLGESILGRGIEAGYLQVEVHDLRRWTVDKHRTADDRPFGGGAGMVLKPEPVFAAIEQLQTPGCRRIYLTPDGTPLSPALALDLSRERHLVLLSGHYEGIDQRIRDRMIDQEISIGDYVLTNGTLAAAVVLDALARFIPGVLGEEKSLTFLNTRVPPNSGVCPFQRFFSLETMLKSKSGGTRDKWKKPYPSDLIYSNNP
jgi:tRNA (guanine37-N1)-methyltransferase